MMAGFSFSATVDAGTYGWFVVLRRLGTFEVSKKTVRVGQSKRGCGCEVVDVGKKLGVGLRLKFSAWLETSSEGLA
jgi:hypothetical protein